LGSNTISDRALNPGANTIVDKPIVWPKINTHKLLLSIFSKLTKLLFEKNPTTKEVARQKKDSETLKLPTKNPKINRKGKKDFLLKRAK
jgi:hypothetical protein